MRSRSVLALFLAFGLAACSDSATSQSANNSKALDAATPIVESVNAAIESDLEITARAADGVPGMVVHFDDVDSPPDYDSLVEQISGNDAVRAFEGELRIWFETQTEPEDRTQDPPFLGSFLITRTYDAKSGERVP